ncbi:MAG: UvrD-helicase domain-containing protein [Bacteroidia bacterium]|nr:UvrD-helicase domain-containing protein [Bacteroidia bacterium]MDW8159015.1 UvrD-helicase domain-containing protein [Bacteroidia bacterium]
MKELLKELNTAQREAVINTEGPTLILAGAGSGKTRVLTYRIAYILSQRLATPWQILALTFTNKAAREMQARIENLIGISAKKLQMGTFHSIFSRILRIEAAPLGYNKDFSIYDEEDATNVIKNIIKELNIDEKKYSPKSIKHFISNQKNYLINATTFNAHYLDGREFTEIVGKVFRLYEIRCKEANAMDFDDLLVNMAILLEQNPVLCQKYQNQFKYILVDEYQDTNHAQYRILKRLAAQYQNLCVVGDDAQSIYSFRGATIENILSFQKDYPNAKVFRLEQNYRSTKIIVAAANYLISHNKNRLEKNVFTQNDTGELIKLVIANSEREEADKIVDWLREQKARYGYKNEDFAILYRTNAQSRVIEDSLRNKGIPYRIFGGISFYQRKEVKDLVAYLRLSVNPYDEEALRRVINYPARGIGDKTIEKITLLAQEKQIPFWQALKMAAAVGKGKALVAIQSFIMLIENFQKVGQTTDAYQAVEYIAKNSGILQDLNADATPEGRSRWENVLEVINAAHEFVKNSQNQEPSLANFLNEIALYTDLDKEVKDKNVVTLMTIHASKGLEFTSVFVTGLEENLFPSSQSAKDILSIEEERRLFYVAITRAQKNLCLSYAQNRYRFGKLEPSQPSRFLNEIKQEFIQSSSVDYKENFFHRAPSFNQKEIKKLSPLSNTPKNSFFSAPSSKDTTEPSPTLSAPQASNFPEQLTPGTRVIHAKFGYGVILEVDNNGENAIAQVDFYAKGKKTLLLKYANLQIVQ